MNKEKKIEKNSPQQDENGRVRKEQRSSAFNEPQKMDSKSTTNIEEEASLEQQRKEAMRERD